MKVPYTLAGVACLTEVGATASLSGKGISGTAAGLKLKAGKKTTIQIKLAKGALKGAGCEREGDVQGSRTRRMDARRPRRAA